MLKFACLCLALALILLNSCSKDDFSEDRNIAIWTNDIPAQNKNLFQIRLAFGKTLAAALQEKELRVFIKEKSSIPGQKLYDELLYKLLKNETLPSGKTVRQLLQYYEDDEVKELFGDSLQDEIERHDPMMVIKIPDVFSHLDWDIDKIIPFVGINTPEPLQNHHYVFYFHNGYNEMLSNANDIFYENVKYFYLMVKYSSDHILLNVNDLTNEKKISLYELLPQIYYCKENVLPKILAGGIRNMDNPNKIILDKRTCYNIWKDNCTYRGQYAYSAKSCGQPIECLRNCDPENPLNKNMVLTGFNVRNELYIIENNLFEESANVSFDIYSTKQPNEIKRFVVPEIRYFDLNKFDVTVTLHQREMVHKNSKFIVPLVSTKYQTLSVTSPWIPINALLFEDLDPDDSRYYYVICINMLYYNDIVNSFNVNNDLLYCFQPFYTGSLILNPSSKIRVCGAIYSWCTNGDIIENNFDIGIKY